MITHTNRKGDAYYLHQGERKSGSVHYYFSKTPNPKTAVTVMPDGYEIHEKPISGQVFLRKFMKSNITDEEAATANEAIRTYSHLPEYAILAERERDAIVIYASEGVAPWSDEMNAFGGTGGVLDFEEKLSKRLGGMLGGYQMQLLSEQECNPRAQSLNERLTRLSNFSPNLKFRLKTTRLKSAQRSQKQQLSERRFEALRYHSTRDNWRYVAEGTLKDLLRSCVPHIGKESYYEL